MHVQVKINIFWHDYRTLEERAERLFSTKGKTDLDPTLMSKPNSGKLKRSKNLTKQKEIANLEAQVYRFVILGL